MKKVIVGSVLMIAMANAFATGQAPQGQTQGQGQGQGQAQGQVALAGALAISGAVSGAQSTAHQSTALTAGQAQGNTQSTTLIGPSTVHYEGGYTVRNTPNAPDAIANPTAPCRIALAGSAAGAGIAIGIGTSILDTGCDAREDARLLVNMGRFDAAISRLCAKPEMALALGTDCPTKAVSAE